MAPQFGRLVIIYVYKYHFITAQIALVSITSWESMNILSYQLTMVTFEFQMVSDSKVFTCFPVTLPIPHIAFIV